MPLARSFILLLTLPLLTLGGCQLVPEKSEEEPAAPSVAAAPEPSPAVTVTESAPSPAPEAREEQQLLAEEPPVVEPTGEAQLLTEEPSTAGPAEEEPSAAEVQPVPGSEVAAEAPEGAPTDLWERARKGFRLRKIANSRITRELKWFMAHGDYLERLRNRAAPYLHFILEETEKRGMPTELALLPAVESAFQPFAYSPGRATGLWQFIPSTGRLYGLKQNWWYDGRRDPVAATNAALDYLQRLSKRFGGDWELALAAYNAGEGTVGRAIRKNRRKGKPTDFWSLKLPRETQSYVPRLLALSQLVANPECFSVELKPIPNEPYFTSVDIQSQLDLALAAEMAELPIEELYRLNPAFNRWATDPEGPHRLLLPIHKAEAFKEKLAALDPSKRLRWKRYKIKNGDNLGTIARKNGTTVTLLRQVNHLKGTRIRAGKHLLIPVSSRRLSHYSLSAKQRKARVQNSTREGNRIEYTVQAGDTWWDIARDYNVDLGKLAKWNGMAPRDILHPGQKLVIWSEEAPATTTQATLDSFRPPDLNAGPAAAKSSLSYRVRRGDSLSRIAQRFNVTVAELKKWNTLPEKYLQPGQRLTLYVDVTEQTL